MIDRVKGGIDIEEVKELKEGAIKSCYVDKPENPKSKPVVYFHHNKGQFVFDVNVPRCLFQNNLEEACNDDLPLLIKAIQDAFRLRDLEVSEEVIRTATIWYLEYGKNIIREGEIQTCLSLISNGLAKGQNTKKIQIYSESGCSGYKIGFKNKGRDVAFYDKTTKELVSKKHFNSYNKALYKKMQDEGKNIIRYEITFYSAKSVNQNLGKLVNKKENLTLQDVWNSTLAQKVLIYYWEDIKKTIPQEISDKDILKKQIIEARANKLPLKEIFQAVGINYCESILGATETKDICIPIETRIGGQKAQYSQYTTVKNKQEKWKEVYDIPANPFLENITQNLVTFSPIQNVATLEQEIK